MQDYSHYAFTKIDNDLKFLMACFGEVLEELGQPELAAALPWTQVPAPGIQPARLGQAYSVAFQLLNLVEENAAAQTRRERERQEGMSAEIACWSHALKRLQQEEFLEAEVAAGLALIRVEPVLTAHPTEAKRLTVLEQHRALFRALGERENPRLTEGEQYAIREKIKAILERLWRTGEILLAKPEVADERRNVLHYLREIFPDVLVRLDDRLKQAWGHAGWSPETLAGNLPQLRFGTWVGGDRDGHPLVTAQVTQESLDEMRLGALTVFGRLLRELAEKMSLSVYGQEPPQELLQGIENLRREVGPSASLILDQDQEEPWRQFVALMGGRLPLDGSLDRPALQGQPGHYRYPDQLRADLCILQRSLEAVGAQRLVETDLQPILRALDTFGFHLANLDVRQNSAFHDQAMAQLLMIGGYDAADFPTWPEAERLRMLNTELRSPRPFLTPGATVGGEAGAVLECYRVLARHLELYGGSAETNCGVGALVVSMTRSLSDLLVVYLLAREAGLMRPTDQGLVCALPVVPLFETVEDLEGSATILRAFLENPTSRGSLERQAQGGVPVQQVMVGYSDSNKDKGIFSSQWALQRAQAAMAEVGQSTGVGLRFFHGRGGTISRGAGPTHRFLDALPHGSLSGDIRLTEQGETIAQKFGNRATATHNLEILMAGVLANSLRHRQRPAPSQPLAAIAEALADSSGTAYRALLNEPGFMTFFRQATPIDALEHARIGSRPSRRTGQATLADLRAIPWVFSWNQSRFYLPGWYGIGTALTQLRDEAPQQFEQLCTSASSWRFMRYVLTNVETNLESTDKELMQAYANLVEDEAIRERLFTIILSERQRTKTTLELILGGSTQVRRKRMLKTLMVRADALKVLHYQQIELLKGWRKHMKAGDEDAADALLPELLLSINAIASGLRTTG